MDAKLQRIFQCKNRARNSILIVAPTSEIAKEICVLQSFAKKSENVTCEDITDLYIDLHGCRGFEIPNDTGQLFQRITANGSSWGVTKTEKTQG